MELNPTSLSDQERYFLLISTVIPRPVAWVSTVNLQGFANLAPFSFFGGVTSKPFTVMVSIDRRHEGRKDSAANLLATGEAVIHIAHKPLAEKMVKTSADVASQVDEFELAGLTKTAAQTVKAYRIKEAAVALESKVVFHKEVGWEPVDMFLLEIIHVYMDDAYVTQGFPDPHKLNAVGRLGGRNYTETNHIYSIPRPR